MNVLFRHEAVDYRAGRLHGEVTVAVPMSWQIIGYLMFVGLVAFIAFLCLASYDRVEKVPGVVVPDKGIVAIAATRPGLISEIFVQEAQHVGRDQPLARIRADEFLGSGQRITDSLDEGLRDQSSLIESQAVSTIRAMHADGAKQEIEAEGLKGEIAALDQQIATQNRLLKSAQEELDLVTPVMQRGFVSRHDLLQRQDALLTREQGLQQLRQTAAAKRSSLNQISRTIAQNAAQGASQIANLKASQAELKQRAATNEASRGYVLKAPLSGMVTALIGRVGQPLGGGATVLSIIPARSTLRAEIFVPPESIGLVAVGQKVKLSAEAYPYQQFGSISGTLLSIPVAPTLRVDPQGRSQPVYVATVAVRRPWLMAYGKRQPLIPGMSLTARITTRRRSLIGWLFDPLFAVSRK